MEGFITVSTLLLFSGMMMTANFHVDVPNQSSSIMIDFIVCNEDSVDCPSYFDLWHVSLGSCIFSTVSKSFIFKYLPAISSILKGNKDIHYSRNRLKLCLVYICLLIVLQSGDTELNPGPTTSQDPVDPMFPCAICHQSCTQPDSRLCS